MGALVCAIYGNILMFEVRKYVQVIMSRSEDLLTGKGLSVCFPYKVEKILSLQCGFV